MAGEKEATGTLYPAACSSEMGLLHPETESKSVIWGGIREGGKWRPSNSPPSLPPSPVNHSKAGQPPTSHRWREAEHPPGFQPGSHHTLLLLLLGFSLRGSKHANLGEIYWLSTSFGS